MTGRPTGLPPRWLGRVLVSRSIRAADAANRVRDWARAARGYERALRLRPDLSAAHIQHGHALKEQGWLHAAAQAYRRAVALPDAGAEPWLHLGHVLKRLELWGEARDAFAAASDRDPACAEAVRELRALRVLPSPDGAMTAAHAVLRAHDLVPSVLRLLDPAFYRRGAAGLAGTGVPGLLDHFGRAGLPAGVPLNAADRFDPAFYRRCVPGLRHAADAIAYRHWLNIGSGEGRALRREVWARRVLATLPSRVGPDIRAIAEAAVAAEAAAEPGEPLLAGMLRRLDGAEIPPGHRAMVLAGASRCLELAGQREAAEALVTQFDLGAPVAALDRLPARTPALVAEAAARLESAGDPEGALDRLARARQVHPDATALRDAAEGVADRAIRTGWDEALAAVAADPAALECSRDRLEARVALVVAALDAVEPRGRRPIRRLGLVGNRDLPQCVLYRLDARLEQCAAVGMPVTLYDEADDLERFHADLPGLDAVIFYRVPGHAPALRAIRAARALGVLTLYEIDDPLFDAAMHPAPFDTYAGSLTQAEHAGLALAVPLYAAAMRECEVGIASTQALAARMRPLIRTGTVHVHPNALGRRHLGAARLQRPSRGAGLRVVYGSATLAGKADMAALLLPGLLALARRFGKALSVTLAGPFDPLPALERCGAVVTRVPTLPLDAWWAVLASADIAVAPLARTPANDTKSAVKWLEAAMLGVPCALSQSAEAERVVANGETGLLCETAEDFAAALLRLAEDAPGRQAMGERARAAVLATHGPDAAASRWRELLAALQPGPAAAARPRIALVNVFAPPQVYGGATRVLADNMADLADRFDLAVFATEEASGPGGRQRTTLVGGVPVTTIRHPGGGDDMQVSDVAMGDRFGAWLQAVRPDLVHVHCVQRLTVSVVEACRARGIPYLITAHDGWWVSPSQFCLDAEGRVALYDHADPAATLRHHGAAAFDRCLRLGPALRGAAAVLAVSSTLAALYRQAGIPGVRVVPNGVSPLPEVPRPGRSDGPVRLGFVGGLYAHKGWLLVEAALADAPSGAFALSVVDHAMENGETREAWIGATRVLFRGKAPPHQMAGLYATLDVLLVPSVWPEAHGLVAREALRCGCWVVASDRGAAAGDIVPGRNGLVVDVSGPDGLRAALATIAAEPDRFRQAPPPTPLRTARQQADDLAVLYRAVLNAPPSRLLP